MALWVCLACGTRYAVGLPRCPHCLSADHEEDGVPKITTAGVSFPAGPPEQEPPGPTPPGPVTTPGPDLTPPESLPASSAPAEPEPAPAPKPAPAPAPKVAP